MTQNNQSKPDYSKAPIESQRRMGRYIPPQQESKHHPTVKPFVWMEKRIWEPILAWGENQALIGILGLLANISLLVGVISYIASEKQRRENAISQAWQTITSAYDQPGNGGRIDALEFLNASPGANWRYRFPWICVSEEWLCFKWNAESLAGVDVAKAYLTRMQLPEAVLSGANLQEANLFFTNLQNAYLVRANLQKTNIVGANLQKTSLQGANLQGADLTVVNLQEAYLWGTNLQEVYLVEANLQGAELFGANLQGAKLLGANLQEASYADEQSSKSLCQVYDLDYPCPTLFPEGFDPQAAGMKLIR